MPKVFLSYRRSDPLPKWEVKSICKRCEECGFDDTFLDCDQGKIPAGSNYREEIEKAIRASDVVLVLIGEAWPRLLQEKWNDPNDMVQLEIHLGMTLGKRVVPILLGGRIPGVDELPEHLREFHYCQGQSFDDQTIKTQLPNFLTDLAEQIKGEKEREKKLAENPLQAFEDKVRQRAEEAERRKQHVDEQMPICEEQFRQFLELRENPYMTLKEVKEALQTLCLHWEIVMPEDWNGQDDIRLIWKGGRPALLIDRSEPQPGRPVPPAAKIDEQDVTEPAEMPRLDVTLAETQEVSDPLPVLGRFRNTQPLIRDGQNIDIPTYLRKGKQPIRLQIPSNS